MVFMWGSFCKTDSSLSASGGRWRWCEACCNGMLAILCWCHYWCYMVLLCRSTTMVMLECLRGEVFANQSLPPVGCGAANTLSLTPISINLSCRISLPHIIFTQFRFLQFPQSFWTNKKLMMSTQPLIGGWYIIRCKWSSLQYNPQNRWWKGLIFVLVHFRWRQLPLLTSPSSNQDANIRSQSNNALRLERERETK